MFVVARGSQCFCLPTRLPLPTTFCRGDGVKQKSVVSLHWEITKGQSFNATGEITKEKKYCSPWENHEGKNYYFH